MKHFSHFLVVLALLSACDAEKPQPVDTGSAYFPLKTGIYSVFDVQEVRYAMGSDPMELNYELRTQVVDSFPSADGYTYVIHRSTRKTGADPWEALDTWSARKEESRVILSEGNTPFVKLTFPVRAGSTWNGNALNTIGEDEYEFKDVGQPLSLGGTTFEKTTTVEQEQNQDVIVFRDERREAYAYGVGLVYKEVIQFRYCTDDRCLGQQIIDEGLQMKMEIIEYGHD